MFGHWSVAGHGHARGEGGGASLQAVIIEARLVRLGLSAAWSRKTSPENVSSSAKVLLLGAKHLDRNSNRTVPQPAMSVDLSARGCPNRSRGRTGEHLCGRWKQYDVERLFIRGLLDRNVVTGSNPSEHSAARPALTAEKHQRAPSSLSSAWATLCVGVSRAS